MKIASNVTDKTSNLVFNKFAEEKAFTSECDNMYWSFGSDDISTASNALQRVIQTVLRKRKNCESWNIKVLITMFIYETLANYK